MIQEVHPELEKHVAVSVHSCQHKFAGAVSLSESLISSGSVRLLQRA